MTFWFILTCLCIGLSSARFANEGVEMAICYGYSMDADSPNFLDRGDLVFKIDRNRDLSISSQSQVTVDYRYSTSEDTASRKVATEFGVKGSYGAFSASASMKVSNSVSSSIKTIRVDSIVKATRYEVSSKGEFRTHPEKFLTANFKSAVKSLSNEQIEKRIGIFFATKLKLGGEIRKSYTMQATKYDTQTSVSSELKASYGAGMMGVSGSASVGVTTRKGNSKAQMSISWAAQGGRTEVWLGKDFSKSGTSVNSVAQEWAKTIDESNYYPSDFQLRPMYELVKAVDARKGASFEKYLKDKWAKNVSAFHPSKFLESEPLISRDPQAKWIIARAKSHWSWCIDQAATAQSWMDTWYAQFDRQRNWNWRRAAWQGRDEMLAIIKLVEDPKLTVKAFKDDLVVKAKTHDSRSKMYWGIGGKDSGESNRVEAATRDAINQMIAKL